MKLYYKSEIWFAVCWIIAYVAGTSFFDELSRMAGLASSFTLVYHIILVAAVFVFLKKNHLFEKYGICTPAHKASNFLYYIPLAAICSVNLWFGLRLNMTPLETVFYVCSMICVGFLEEIIFRGFLFCAMAKNSLRSAVIVSSVTFGIGHIVNLINGSGADLLSNLCQVFYAISFGYLCVVIFIKSKSLVPCIACHSIVNALSAFVNEDAMTNGRKIITALFLFFTALIYALFLEKNKKLGKGTFENEK